MDYISSVFPFDQIDELLQFSSVPSQQHTIQQNILVTPSLFERDHITNQPDCSLVKPSLFDKDHVTNLPDYSRQRKSSVAFGDIDDIPNDYKKKKIIHRDVERQRRQEMAALYRSLRLLLPLQYLKGKRSISDHTHETVNYIKHLQKRIQELNDKRDGLKRLSNLDNLNVPLECSKRTCPQDSVTVKICRAGVQVVLSTALRGGLPLSKVLDVLIQEGLTIVCCISTKVNERLLHTIEVEVRDGKSVDPSALQQKLTNLVT